MNSRYTRLFMPALALIVGLGVVSSADAQDPVNIAPTGTASQSTQLNAFSADLAIDSNFGNFTHTQAGNGGSPVVWWMLDFGAPKEFEQIILHNRGGGCCQSRLRDITVFVLDDPFILTDALTADPLLTVEDLPDILDDAIIFQSELLNAENVDGGGGTGGPPSIDSGLAELIEGQVIVVTRTPDPDNSGTGGQGNADEGDVLSLGEVEVMGVVECPEEGDTHCTGMDIAEPLEGGAGLYTVTASGEDDGGDAVLFTFTFEGPNGELLEFGPQASNTASANLGPGEWTITVLADDEPFCPDLAVDAECIEEIEVAESANLALGKTAVQSSDYGNGQFPASFGVDGNLGNFTHTLAGNNGLGPATWRVDIGREADVAFINIFNRTNCCSSRLRDLTVQVLDSDLETPLFETPLLNPENIGGAFPIGPATIGVDLVHLTGAPVTGYGVRIVREPDPDNSGTDGQGNADEATVLSLGEVEIYEPRDDCEAESDAHCDGMTITGPEDAGPGVYTVDIQGVDDSGDPLLYSVIAENQDGDIEYTGQSQSSTLSLLLTAGTWTIRAIVDDNPRCDNETADSDCEQVIEVGDCEEGDTHCEDILVDGPSDGGPGVYTFTAIAEDDSLDPIQYRFSTQLDGGEEVQTPFQESDVAQFVLSPGIWTVRVLAVDATSCLENEAADALCETTVEVGEAGENVALNKPADQTSQLGFFTAAAGTDGNFANFTHTLAGNDGLGPAIWEVDLGADFEIGRILAHNRTSCCGSRLRDIIISVHDVSFRDDVALDPLLLEPADFELPLWEDSIFETDLLNPENELGTYPLGPPALQVDLAGEGVVGRFVRITRLTDTDLSGSGGAGNQDEATVLSLGELEVFLAGDPVECPVEGDADFGDTECSGVTASGPAGDVAGDWTFTASATDDTGDTIRYSFEATSDGGASLSSGPSASDSATFTLTPGTWTVAATVDDDPACSDDGGDTECSVEVVVREDGGGEGLGFLRGDTDGNGQILLNDSIQIFGWLFQGGAEPGCVAAADASGQGQVNLTSGIYGLNFLFTGGGPPPAPFPACAKSENPSDLTLGCLEEQCP